MSQLIETIYDPNKPNIQMPGPGSDFSGSQCLASGPTQPLSMALLDSLTVHAKMSLIHGIVTKVVKLGMYSTE
jgi:mediator of RNA polymerase II transcription subunit 23